MQEEYLHYIFKTKLLGKYFVTTKGDKLEIVNFGYHNNSSGPDFLECQILLNGQLWAGQIEFHVKSSDWFKHKHQFDSNYNNVIAHFVFEHDIEIQSGQYELPTVELSECIDKVHYTKYHNYITSKNWVACENEMPLIDNFVIYQQKEKALFNRLTRKSDYLVELLQRNTGDQQKIFFSLLFKAFGSKVNQVPFEKLASKFDSKVVLKLNNNLFRVQAYLFGLAGFLNDEINVESSYFNELCAEFEYQKKMFDLTEMNIKEWKFSAVRPANYPTVRIAQLTHLLIKDNSIIKTKNSIEIINSLTIELDEYWKKHYMFGRVGKKSNGNLTKDFVNLILINVYVPFYFSIGIYEGDYELKNRALSWLESISPEKNSIIKKWKENGVEINSAFDTQALLELKHEFCDKNQCLKCRIGQKLLKN